MSHGRKYRDGDSHPLPIWSGILEHRKRLGLAIYEFIWCIDKVTKEHATDSDGKSDGLVLGGASVKLQQIAKDLGEDYRTAQRNMDLLESENYITRKRTAYGFSVMVHNSRKFKIWGNRVDKSVQSGSGESGQMCPVSGVETGQKCPERLDRSVRNKEDHAVDHAVKNNHAVTPLPLAGGFEEFYWSYPRKRNRPAAEKAWRKVKPEEVPLIMARLELAKLEWKGKEIRYVPYPATWLHGRQWEDELEPIADSPASIVRAKARIAEREREQAGSLPELEAVPWAK
jgi:hypothetical protein